MNRDELLCDEYDYEFPQLNDFIASDLVKMDQLDGCNESVCSSIDENELIIQSIPLILNTNLTMANFPPKPEDTPSWYDPFATEPRLPSVKRRINRFSRHKVGMFLPSVSTCNILSLMPKVNNFTTDMLERDIDVVFLSEIWEKTESKKHKFEIKKLLELNGLKYISTPRLNNKRGEEWPLLLI